MESRLEKLERLLQESEVRNQRRFDRLNEQATRIEQLIAAIQPVVLPNNSYGVPKMEYFCDTKQIFDESNLVEDRIEGTVLEKEKSSSLETKKDAQKKGCGAKPEKCNPQIWSKDNIKQAMKVMGITTKQKQRRKERGRIASKDIRGEIPVETDSDVWAQDVQERVGHVMETSNRATGMPRTDSNCNMRKKSQVGCRSHLRQVVGRPPAKPPDLHDSSQHAVSLPWRVPLRKPPDLRASRGRNTEANRKKRDQSWKEILGKIQQEIGSYVQVQELIQEPIGVARIDEESKEPVQ